ncbi:ABC transporter substrate-binding protein [Paenibacillus flagellatus]|uniref:ABC transporter substrate-binding protein n=1 Tax=Paenibacillus flagellatus TaxID=2211139 RepID=A0A2V5K3L8_9BACL|nr:extracellular solute-binding protein [Paenibacillus flagellatus]PYI53801.1 hypothetical protein DLM86_14685 [Paenibacillus flagellatus]
MLRSRRFDWEKELRHFPLNPKGVPAKLKQSVEERIAMEATSKRIPGKWWAAAAALLLASAVLFVQREPILGLFKPDTAPKPFDAVTERSVKVQWYDGMSFMSRYGQAFVIRYPNMDVETVNSPPYDPSQDRAAQYEAMIEKEKPDVVYLPMDVFPKLAAKGLLLPLDSIAAKDNYDWTVYRDGVLSAIREAGGGGELYGLSPNYTVNALYYNKTLFDRYGVPYPQDRMSWEELFQLARRFPAGGTGDERVYGFVNDYASPFGTADSAARTAGLGLTDADATRMTANSEPWRTIWTYVADGVSKGWLYETPPRTGTISGIDYYKRNPFLTGNAAMMLTRPNLANDLVQAKKRHNLANFDWQIVTEPVDPARPDVSSTFAMEGVYAIPASSPNVRDAWEMIKHIHSEPMAKKVAIQYDSNVLSSLASFVSKTEGPSLEAFSRLKPDGSTAGLVGGRMTNELYGELTTVVDEEIKAAAAGSKSVDDAIDAIQLRGQQALDKANAANKP